MHTMSGSTPQCSTARNLPVRPRPVCTSSATSSAPYFLQSAAAPGRYSSLGMCTPWPMIGSTMKAATSLPRSAFSSAGRSSKGIRTQSGSSGPKPVAELLHAVDRERAVGEPVIAALDVDDLRALGRVARELDRGLDRLRARVAEEHLLEPGGHLRDEPFGEQAREHRHVHLHQMRQAAVQDVVQDLDHLRVVAADREDAPAGEQVEVAIAGRVEEIGTARLGVRDVVADRLQHLHDLPVQVLVVQRVLLGQALVRSGRGSSCGPHHKAGSMAPQTSERARGIAGRRGRRLQGPRWLCIGRDLRSGAIAARLFDTAAAVAEQDPLPDVIGWDIPIGLCRRTEPVAAVTWRHAAHSGAPRASSVFTAPIRAALAAATRAEASAHHGAALRRAPRRGPGLRDLREGP